MFRAQVALCFLVTVCTAVAAPLKYQDIFGSGTTTNVSAGTADAAGNVYLTGWTTSPSLPVTPDAFQKNFIQSQCGTNYHPGPNGSPGQSFPIPCAHAFIAKIAADGASLVYLTYLGGELTDYVNAIGGRALYSPEVFLANGIRLHFLSSQPVEYPQFNVPFVPSLSVIDVLMFNPREQARELLQRYELA